jgi:hypothetical protein
MIYIFSSGGNSGSRIVSGSSGGSSGIRCVRGSSG